MNRDRYPFKRDTSTADPDTGKLVGGLALLLGAGLALKYFVLDKAPAPTAPAPSLPSPIPGVPGVPGVPGLPSAPSPGLPSLPGVTPLAMSVGVGDTVLVSSAVLGPPAPGAPTAIEMVIVEASPGSPTVLAKFVDEPYKNLPPMTVPRQAIIGVSKTPSAPTPGSPGGPPSGTPLFLDDPLRLRTGQRYRARVQLGITEGLFASRSMIEGQFTALGFSNVGAYEPEATPPDWPPSTKKGDLTRTWFVEGTWSQPEKNVAKPSQVVMAWEG